MSQCQHETWRLRAYFEFLGQLRRETRDNAVVLVKLNNLDYVQVYVHILRLESSKFSVYPGY